MTNHRQDGPLLDIRFEDADIYRFRRFHDNYHSQQDRDYNRVEDSNNIRTPDRPDSLQTVAQTLQNVAEQLSRMQNSNDRRGRSRYTDPTPAEYTSMDSRQRQSDNRLCNPSSRIPSLDGNRGFQQNQPWGQSSSNSWTRPHTTHGIHEQPRNYFNDDQRQDQSASRSRTRQPEQRSNFQPRFQPCDNPRRQQSTSGSRPLRPTRDNGDQRRPTSGAGHRRDQPSSHSRTRQFNYHTRFRPSSPSRSNPLYRQNNNQRQTTTSTATKNATRNNNRSATEAVFRFVQLRHHLNNWESMPGSIRKNIEKNMADIHPPCPNEILRDELQRVTKTYISAITEVVTDHIERKIHENATILQQMEYPSEDNFQEVVAELCTHRLGRRLNRQQRDRNISRALSVLRSPPRNVPPQPTPMDSASPPPPPPNLPLISFLPPPNYHHIPVPNSIISHPPSGFTTSSDVAISNSSPTDNPSLTTLPPPAHPQVNQNTADSISNSSTPKPNSDQAIITRSKRTLDDSTSPFNQLNTIPKRIQRDRSISPPPSPSPPSSPNDADKSFTNSTGRKIFYKPRSQTNGHWTLKLEGEARSIIIGGSNSQRFPDPPLGWQTHSFPGISFSDLASLLKQIPKDTSITNLVIYVGVNDRGNYLDNLPDEFSDALSTIHSFGIQTFYVSTPLGKHLSIAQNQNVTQLNRLTRELFGNRFILPKLSNFIDPYDKNQIHLTSEAAETTLETIVSTTQSLNSQSQPPFISPTPPHSLNQPTSATQ